MNTVHFKITAPLNNCCNSLKILLCAASLFTISCKTHQNELHETSGTGIKVQIIQLKKSDGDASVVTYKARLVPDASLLNEKSLISKDAMIYKMDSCFYLQSGPEKIYASLVQPIANGVSGTFEYLLEFEMAPGSAKPDFIYQDKYLNHKKYSLKLN